MQHERYLCGTLVKWSGDNDKVWTVIEWQPNNGLLGAYWIRREGINGVAGEDELTLWTVKEDA